MSFTDLAAAAVAGAFLYHVYAKVQNLEQAMASEHVVHLGESAGLDIADGSEDTEGSRKFGFSSTNRR